MDGPYAFLDPGFVQFSMRPRQLNQTFLHVLEGRDDIDPKLLPAQQAGKFDSQAALLDDEVALVDTRANVDPSAVTQDIDKTRIRFSAVHHEPVVCDGIRHREHWINAAAMNSKRTSNP